jgi:hypothetical protein
MTPAIITKLDQNPEVPIFADIQRIGPGIWYVIHLQAARATTPELQNAFISNTIALANNFKCQKCKVHFLKYIEKFPLQQWTQPLPNTIPGLFAWTVNFHNEVNRFLKKPIMAIEDAYKIYTDDELGACFNCGSETPSNTPLLVHGPAQVQPTDVSVRPQPKPIMVPTNRPMPFKLISRN